MSTNITSFDDLQSRGRRRVAEALVAGKPLGGELSGLIHLAAAFGGDEAKRGGSIGATVEYTKFDDLIADTVALAFDDLFKGRGLDQIVRDVLLAGAAYGFRATNVIWGR
jgi:hypothetical protein